MPILPCPAWRGGVPPPAGGTCTVIVRQLFAWVASRQPGYDGLARAGTSRGFSSWEERGGRWHRLLGLLRFCRGFVLKDPVHACLVERPFPFRHDDGGNAVTDEIGQ